MVDPTLTVFRNMLLLSDLEEAPPSDNARMPERLRTTGQSTGRGQGLRAGHWSDAASNSVKYQDLTGRLTARASTLRYRRTGAFCARGVLAHQELELLVESG